MSRRLTQLTLFASSTSEAAAEVSALRKVIEGLNKLLESTHAITLRMLAWPDDIRPGVNTDAQSEINRQVAGYDIYLGLLGTRFGTPTPRGESGTQEEFEAALSRFSSDTTSVRLLFYFKKSLVGINPYELDVEGLQKVQRFRDNIKARGVLSRDFDNTEDFIDLVKTHVVDLIAKEWRSETERWAPADAPAQPPALVREQPRAGLDTTSGDAARPKSRASESKKSAPPDEDDLEDADEDGLGLLDHVENLHSVTKAMTVTFESMSKHIKLVGEKISKRAKEIEEVQQSQAKARTADGATQQLDVARLKNIINGAADDVMEFVGDLAQDVDAYRVDNRVMLSELRGMLEVRREFNSGKDNDYEDLKTFRNLIETMKTVKGQVGGFQKSIQEAPALTGKFKNARRRGVSMLGELIAEISFSIDETKDIIDTACGSRVSPSGASNTETRGLSSRSAD